MKKGIALVIITLVLVIGALYTVKSYNKTNSNSTTASSEAGSSTIQSNTGSSGTGLLLKPGEKTMLKAPDFKLKDLNGKEVSLSDYKGKNVLLNFWASWCPPCRAEMPDIEKLYQETKNTDTIILAVNLGEDRGTVKSFIDANKYNFNILLDSDQQAAAEFNISSIPSWFFINKDGNIVTSHIGAMSLAQMKSYVQLLENK